jgi:hypothetical protein
MRFPRVAASLLIAASIFVSVSTAPGPAQARNLTLLKATHKVEVQYWFWDTDYYYWSTKFESSDLDDAQFVYGLLFAAKQNGQLNQVAPNSNWKYFAVDVRLITEYHYPIQIEPLRASNNNMHLTGSTIR